MPDIAIAAKRYDGLTSVTTFTGCIPLKPGQLFETNTGLSSGTPLVAQASLRGNVSLWRASGPAEIPAYITALYPQHPDGSIKGVMVSTILTLALGEQHDMFLRIGTSPTLAASPTAHPTINAAWMKHGNLIGCTDAFHMCAARVAPGPLIAMDDPRLPAKYKTWLTDEFDLKSTHWSTYGWVLERLRVHGDMGAKRCILTNGSAVVTVIGGYGGGGLTPQTPPTTGLTAGLAAGSMSPFGPGTQPGTTILSVDSDTQITLNKTALADRVGIYVYFGAPWPWNNANYDALAPMYYRYMTTGVLDKLHEANMLAQDPVHDDHNWVDNYAPDPARGAIGFTTGLIKYAEAYQGIPANTNFPTAEYGQALNTNPVGGTEWQSGFKHAAYLCYVMSGWMQPLGVAVSWGVRDCGGTFAGVDFGNAGPGSEPGQAGFQYGIRLILRAQRLASVFYYLLSMPMKLSATNYTNSIGHSPRLAANKTAYRAMFQWKVYDGLERWAQTIPLAGSLTYGPGAQFYPAHPITGATTNTNVFMRGIWGCADYFQPSAPAYENGQPYYNERGGWPTFGAIHVFNIVLFTYMNVLEDSRMQAKLVAFIDLLYRQARKYPTPITFDGAPSPRQAWVMPSMVSDPALYPNVGDAGAFHNYYSAAINQSLWSWAWAVTGDAKYLEIADDTATCKAMASTPTAGNGHSQKTLGEGYQAAFFSAAWRSGETWGVLAEGEAPPSAQVVVLGLATTTDTPLAVTPIGGTVANLTFNVAKGRVVEFYNRVKTADPSTCALLWVALALSGLETDAVLLDKDTLADVLTGATNEATNTGYARIVVVAADIAALSVDDTNDRIDLDLPDPTWAAIDGDGTGAIGKLLLCYRPATASADSAVIPLNMYDFSIPSPDGSAVTAQVNVAGAHRAT